ncbi:DUF6879 family protein [Actinoallomurus rhizosphaericola]|uniref:DUF6879 family protein n=1 Tax=Actinoallomurus rhizosphaericola TaxID=2952536 RepID=UPI002092C5C1|nr:DUF6879 family protein [Actinoallomurus rhizosphaericola]MCO5997769.1 hypothetical protein [Actinoallomurus rhizosphaericola]
MLDRIRRIPGQTLDVASYHALRRQETQHLTGPIWKLERSQYFHEPDDDPSWRAFVENDWARVIAVFESERAEARAEVESYARQGSELRRLRVVERPVSPYLLWEMQWFRILADEGTLIRVLDARQIESLERDAVLPEIVVDEHALYHVSYDEDWRACGARRIHDPHVMREATREIAALWESAEPFAGYFTREIMTLLPSAP